MRADIAQALEQLDPAGRRQIKTSRERKRCLASLEDSSDEVIALLPAGPPLGKVVNFGDVVNATRDQRLLVLTERSFLELSGNGGMLIVGDVMVIEVPLERIHDGIRMNVQRRMGTKVRMLAVDHLVGSTVETLGYEVAAREESVSLFVKLANIQIEEIHEQIADHEERKVQQRAEQAAAAVARQVAAAAPRSTADEIERLAALLERGLLTPEEFAVEKAKVLGGPATLQ